MESGILGFQLLESGTPLTIGIRYPSSIDKESRIRDCCGLSYMHEGSGLIFSEIRCSALGIFQTSKGFCIFCSVNHLSGPVRKQMFTCTSSKGHGLRFGIGGFRSVLFVSCFKVRCFVIVLFRAIIDQLRLLRRFFCSFSFLSLAIIKQRHPPSFEKNPRTIAISFAILEQSSKSHSQPSWENVLHCDLH